MLRYGLSPLSLFTPYTIHTHMLPYIAIHNSERQLGFQVVDDGGLFGGCATLGVAYQQKLPDGELLPCCPCCCCPTCCCPYCCCCGCMFAAFAYHP